MPRSRSIVGFFRIPISGFRFHRFRFHNSSFVVLLLLFNTAPVLAQTDFYRGKTMTFIVNMAAGDANDLWARALARSLVKYIPGHPNIIVQNMAGGGSLIATNFLYKVAKPDGLTLGQTSASLYFQQLIGRPEVQFDWKKFSLDWRRRPSGVVAADAQRCAVQVDGRSPRRRRAAQMFGHGGGRQQSHQPESIRGRAGREISHRHGLQKRQRSRSRHRARRGAVPGGDCRFVSRSRAVYDVAERKTLSGSWCKRQKNAMPNSPRCRRSTN